jgi:hypothetical protein
MQSNPEERAQTMSPPVAESGIVRKTLDDE